FVEEANLNVHVSAIRKAIGESAQRPRYIATIPGRGYRFTAKLHAGDAPSPPQRRRPRFAIAFAAAVAVLSGLVPLLYSRCAPHDRKAAPQSVPRSVPRSAEAQR